MVARENFDGPPVWNHRRSFSQDNRTSPRNWQKWRDTRNQGLHVVPVALGVLVMPYFFSFLLEAKSREPVCNQGGGLDCPSSAILAQRSGRFETKVSRPTCLSTSNVKQNTERRRVGWDEQQLHRSLDS
jgi:hypothetical protein